MTVTAFRALACPLDGQPLHCDGASWRCAAGHGFDVARQGYVNLLPVQQKRSRDPGDSKAMVEARQRFLNAGFYRPVADAVSRWVLDRPRQPGPATRCLDAGCGEGYYLRQLAAAAATAADAGNGVGVSLLGLDVSKWAVLAAARQDRRPGLVVGTNASLPVQSGSLDCVLCLFGFSVYPEFARVLAPNGRLLRVDSGPDHLRELREIIYPRLKSAPEADFRAPDGFRLLSRERLRYSVALNEPEQITDLLTMTPHLYRASQEGREKAMALQRLSITVDVRLTSFAVEHAHHGVSV